MFAHIRMDGYLILQPTSETEAYAAKEWFSNFKVESELPSGLSIDYSLIGGISPNPSQTNA